VAEERTLEAVAKVGMAAARAVEAAQASLNDGQPKSAKELLSIRKNLAIAQCEMRRSLLHLRMEALDRRTRSAQSTVGWLTAFRRPTKSTVVLGLLTRLPGWPGGLAKLAVFGRTAAHFLGVAQLARAKYAAYQGRQRLLGSP